ncbi:prepilin peptidase [Chloroflexota bacterium]
MGSFLNVCIDRLPRDQSLLGPPSHCPACGKRLGVFDLIPVVSYLLLRGRCRGCGAAIGRRTLIVELVTGFMFFTIAWYYGFGGQFLLLAYYASLFLMVTVIDLEHRLILNKVVYPALPVSFVLSFFVLPEPHFPSADAASALFGCVAALGLLALPNLFYQEGMGWGDVKLAGLIGMATGMPVVLVALMVSIVSGGLIAIGFLLLGGKGRKGTIPFGPFLTLGAMVALLWGEGLIDWYRGLLGLG